MELKAFKGMPHEFGGIDYTEGSEVEGGEFAVQIGKSGNEYIFDKNSSEGERLSKEYKRLDKNGRLTEDDPLALETFDQIAREEALKHAQRSVNEKGIDPFRNMYEQGGQAANGGVKYATGGPMMNPAEVPNVNPGAQYNTSMSYAPMTMEDYNRQTLGESRMRDSFGTQDMRTVPATRALKEAPLWVQTGQQALDVMFGQVVTSFGGDSPGAMAGASLNYGASDATKRAVGDDTMIGTAYGYGQAQSKDVITGMGDSFFGKEGGALPKNKYSDGGVSGKKDMYQGGGGWIAAVKGVKSIKGGTRGVGKTAFDQSVSDKFGEEYVRQSLPMQGGPSGGFAMPQNKEQVEQEATFTGSGLDKEWMMDPNQTYAMPPASDTTSMVGTDVPIDLGIGNTGGSFGSFGGFKNGGAKPIYGYYANGGGKSYTDKIKEAEDNLNQFLGNPMNKAIDDFSNEFQNNPRLAGDDMYLDPYRHGMAGYYTADAMKKKMPSWIPESIANKLAIAGSTIAGVGHEFASPSTDRMGLVDALTEAGQDAYNNYVGAKMIEDVLFDREAKQLMLDKIKREETYPGVVLSKTQPYNLPKNTKEALERGLTFEQIMDLEKKGLIDLNDGTVEFQNGGGKKKDEEDSFTDKLKGYVKDFADPYVKFSERNRGVADALFPPHVAQYLYTMSGGTEPFTEKQLSDNMINTYQNVLENREVKDKYKDIETKSNKGVVYDDKTNLGYDDFNRFNASYTENVFNNAVDFIKAFTHDPTIAKFLTGKASVQETDDAYIIQSDYDFAKEKDWKDLKGLDHLAYLWNMSPYADTEAMSVKKGSKAPINITIPKRKMEAKKTNPYYNTTSSYPMAGF